VRCERGTLFSPGAASGLYNQLYFALHAILKHRTAQAADVVAPMATALQREASARPNKKGRCIALIAQVILHCSFLSSDVAACHRGTPLSAKALRADAQLRRRGTTEWTVLEWVSSHAASLPLSCVENAARLLEEFAGLGKAVRRHVVFVLGVFVRYL